MLDCEGHGHKAVVYKSHFPPLRHSVVTETPADTLANKPRLTKDQALCSLYPHDKYHRRIYQVLLVVIPRQQQVRHHSSNIFSLRERQSKSMVSMH